MEKINGIKVGSNINVPFGDLIWSRMNRKKNKKHALKIGESIKTNGMLRSFTVTRPDKNGKRKLLDMHHGQEGCTSLFKETDNVPCYEISWIDPNDDTQIKEKIMLLNKDRKNWDITDYIVSHKIDNIAIYKNIYDTLKQYGGGAKNKKTKGLTSGTVVCCWDKKSRAHDEIKDGVFKYNMTRDWRFTEDMLKFFYDKVNRLNKLGAYKQLPNSFTREIAERVWIKIKEWKYEYDKFQKLLSILGPGMITSAKEGLLPGNGPMIAEWFDNYVQEVE